MKFRSITLSNGEYVGDTDWRGRPHGEGVIYYKDGDEFCGEFVHGVANGHGLWNYANGEEFSSDYVNGVAHGHAMYYGTDGSEYELQMSNGKVVSSNRLR